MALPIRRREVVGFSDPGGEAHRFSLRVRLPSLVPSRDPTVALRPRVHVISERMPGGGAFEEGVRKRLQPDGLVARGRHERFAPRCPTPWPAAASLLRAR